MAADPRTWRVVLLPPEGAPTELAHRVDLHRRALLEQLRSLLDWGLARRGGPALDPELFARAVFSLSEEAARLVLADPAQWPLERFTAFTRALLGGLSRSVG